MKLCVALDMDSKHDNLSLLESLKEHDDLYVKVGLRSFIRDGYLFLDEIRKIANFKIFLDLKLYDIPNTMFDSIDEIIKLGIDMVTIHASSGREAMNSIATKLSKVQNPPIILAVTALTSFDDSNLFEIYNDSLESCVLKFAKLSYECGINGVVCSCFESKMIKTNIGNDFLTLTPGIRPFGESVGDQKRVANIKEAFDSKSDFIVVGRPIYKAQNPKEAVKRILNEMKRVSNEI